MAQSETTHPLGVWSLIGTWGICVIVTLTSDQLPILYSSLMLFLQGDATAIAQIESSPQMIISVVAINLAFELPLAVLVMKLVHAKLGEVDNVLTTLFHGSEEKRYFQMIFLTVLAEEVLARWLFMGLLPQVFPGTVSLYVLFFIGNGAWALVHLLNIPDKSKRHPLRVLTQFIGGAFLTVIFLRYGFLATLIAHLAFNALVFSTSKKQAWGPSNLLLTIYYAAVATISFVLMSSVTRTDFGTVSSWLTLQPQLTVTGWDFLDYVLLYVFVASLVAIALELLGYDQNDVNQLGKKQTTFWTDLFYQAMGVLILLGAYHLTGLFMTNVPHRLIVIALLLAMVSASQSGSAMARTFWESMPGLYLMLGCIVGLGFWGGIVFILLVGIIMKPARFLIVNGTRTYQPAAKVPAGA